MYILSYIFEGPEALPNMITQMSALGWACLLFTVCGATWLGSTLWGMLLRTYPASIVMPFALLIPVFGITFGQLFLDEQFNALTYAACGIVFLGLLINQWRPTIISITPFEVANRILFPKKAA
jgi:O-acetylserine/cysteine efflux transporter